MKFPLLVPILLLASSTQAQPIIANKSNLPAVGFTAPVSIANVAPISVSNGGSNQTWDFTTFNYTPAGDLEVVDPSLTPMAASFPQSNYAFKIGTAYSFFNAQAIKMEVMAWSILAAGSGNDYSPNPRTILKFPFTYGDLDVDAWQKVGGSQSTVTIAYDGFGTLIAPSGTYNNVVRIRESYGAGDDDYVWYTVNPLLPIAIYDHNNQKLYHIATMTNSVKNINNPIISKVYPNPSQGNFSIIGASKGSTIRIFNLNGQLMHQEIIKQSPQPINAQQLTDGLYILETQKENVVGKQKLLIQH